eukprot:g352.t1
MPSAASFPSMELLQREYTKIKKQHSVLKRAVIREQEKGRDLNADLREKDNELKASLKEIDRLTETHERLTKRIIKLQEENESLKKDGGGGWFGGVMSSVTGESNALKQIQDEMSVLLEELQQKIGENEQCHMKIFELQKTTRAAVESEEMQREAHAKRENELSHDIANKQQFISELADAKEKLQNDLDDAKEDAESVAKKHAQQVEEMTQLNLQMTKEIVCIRHRVQERLPFDDTSEAEQNCWNLSQHDERSRREREGKGSRFASIFSEACQRFYQLCAVKREQLQLRQHLLFTNNEKDKFSNRWKDLCVKLVSLLRVDENSVAQLQDISLLLLKKIYGRSKATMQQHERIQNTLPVVLLQLDDEISRATDDRLRSCNQALAQEMSRFGTAANSLCSHLTVFSSSKVDSFLVDPRWQSTTLFLRFLDSVKHFLDTFISIAIASKAQIDLENVQAFIPPQLRQCNIHLYDEFDAMINVSNALKVAVTDYFEVCMFEETDKGMEMYNDIQKANQSSSSLIIGSGNNNRNSSGKDSGKIFKVMPAALKSMELQSLGYLQWINSKCMEEVNSERNDLALFLEANKTEQTPIADDRRVHLCDESTDSSVEKKSENIVDSILNLDSNPRSVESENTGKLLDSFETSTIVKEESFAIEMEDTERSFSFPQSAENEVTALQIYYEKKIAKMEENCKNAKEREIDLEEKLTKSGEHVRKLQEERKEQMRLLRMIKAGMERSREEYTKKISSLSKKCADLEEKLIQKSDF